MLTTPYLFLTQLSHKLLTWDSPNMEAKAPTSFSQKAITAPGALTWEFTVLVHFIVWIFFVGLFLFVLNALINYKCQDCAFILLVYVVDKRHNNNIEICLILWMWGCEFYISLFILIYRKYCHLKYELNLLFFSRSWYILFSSWHHH